MLNLNPLPADKAQRIILSGIPQSDKCSLSQMLLSFNTFESPLVTKVSAAVSTASLAPAELSSFKVPYPLSAGIKAIACEKRA